METLPPARLREVQLLKLRRMVQWAWQNSPFYRAKFDRAGVKPRDIQSLDDLGRFPLTEKSEWLAAQGSEPPTFGKTTAVPEADVIRYHQTSGTSGNPIRLAFSLRDWNVWLECWGYGLSAAQLTARDRILVCFPFNLFVGWWGGQDAARLLGCRVYSGGGMSSLERLEVVRDHHITALMGAPSYLLRLALTAKNELGLKPGEMGVRRLICGAEAGGSIPAMRQRLEEAWKAEVFDHLGASEVGPWGYECSDHPGGVHICEAFFLLEFLDPIALEPAAPGELARVVITSLEKYAQPVIRWDLKDLVRLSESACPCGRTFRRVEGGILGRADDLIKTRGVLFSPQAVEDVVRTFEQIRDYRVVISQGREMDELTIQVETGLKGKRRKRLMEDLVSALKLKTHLRFAADFLPEGTLPNQDVKTPRVMDLRQKGGSSGRA